MSEAGTEAVTCVLLTKVVVRALPFQETTDDDKKPAPESVRVVAPAPAITLAGVIAVIDGTGLFTVKLIALEVPPAGIGLETATAPTAPRDSLAAGNAALTSVPLTNVVTSGTPFQVTMDEGTKPLPLTSRDRAAEPASALAGLIDVSTGEGFSTTNGAEADVPPPGPGFTTVTTAVVPFTRSLAGRLALKAVEDA
jgi:hypothetical protein